MLLFKTVCLVIFLTFLPGVTLAVTLAPEITNSLQPIPEGAAPNVAGSVNFKGETQQEQENNDSSQAGAVDNAANDTSMVISDTAKQSGNITNTTALVVIFGLAMLVLGIALFVKRKKRYENK